MTATYTSGSSTFTRDVTTSATWSTSDSTAVAEWTYGGHPHAMAVGPSGSTATLTASYGGLTDDVNANVTDPVVQYLEAVRDPVVVNVNDQLQVTAHMTDDTTRDVSSDMTWESADNSVAVPWSFGSPVIWAAVGNNVGTTAFTGTYQGTYGGPVSIDVTVQVDPLPPNPQA